MTIRRAGRRGGAGGSNGAKRCRRLVIPAASLAACGVFLAACGGGGVGAASTTDRPTSASSTSATTSTSTADPATAAVLAAYRAASGAFVQALTSADPNDPALAATMVNPELQSVRANLLADQRQGIVGRGLVTLHPKVASVSAASATVLDCAYSASELVYAASGKPVPPVTPPENDGVRATLVLTGGTWKLSKQTVTEGKCAPGS